MIVRCWNNRRTAKDQARAFVSWSQTGYVPYTFYMEIIVMIKPSQMTTQLLSLPHLHSWACLRFPAILQTMSKLNTHSCFYSSTLNFRVGWETTATCKLLAYVLCSTEKTVYQSLIRFWVFHLQYNKTERFPDQSDPLTLAHTSACWLVMYGWHLKSEQTRHEWFISYLK